MTPSRRLSLIATLARRRVSGERVVKSLPPILRAKTILLDNRRKVCIVAVQS